ncbi:non-ribosomal peptide synthetase [Rhodococcus sp. P1Y]|uniref:non-ribosomal peptide synthetase n=1 Tax=Rhodococcus sp. P1Y TaxID=1302308 RepID=UPI000EABF2BE|nr:non-ribosomal peptide synthetase [Rhodococcus sp. P1Y]AYJ49061.1 amino acid adenylation domain-containing protein [Rhodococcus sp. P1Y]
MVFGGSGSHSTAIDDLPGLVARVVVADADRTAIALGDVSVSYGDLHRELSSLDTAMGGVLGADALVPLALSTLVPGAVETADGGLEGIVAAVVDDARSVLGDDAPTQPGRSADTLPSRFRAQVERTPDAVALVFEDTTLTYAEFDERVNRLARRLLESGVGPDVRVGLSISRSIDLLVAMYAIVEAGAAYVPLDPSHPADRISYVLSIAEPALVLTASTEQTELPASMATLIVDTEDLSAYSPDPLTDGERVLGGPRPENTAYVIFTSGSTGRPKGVAVSHEAIVANLDWRQADYPLTADDVVLQKTPFTFDVSVWEFFWPLQTGASLVIAAPDGHRDPAYIAETMSERSVTTAHFVPSMLSVFLGQFGDPSVTDGIPSLRQVFASGEALPASAARSFHSLFDAELHNLYGPTEAAVDVTYHRTDSSDAVSVPIGVAVPRTELHVLDEGLNRTPPGVPGELYLSGVQLARGYLNRPDLTADRFVADVVAGSGQRMYRTGDLVRWNSAGVLEYLGRTDFQVKLRGLRIELGEIEAALLAQDTVQQAVVVVLSDDSETGVDDRLVAYVVTSTGEANSDALAAGVRDALPDYMVPAVFVALDAFPLNASGKLDRGALPKPDTDTLKAEYRAPATAVERTLVAVFEDILGSSPIGVDDDFFLLGGNSLSATRAIARVNADLKVKIDVRGFFDAPTAAGLAAEVDSARSMGGPILEPLTKRDRPDVLPLSLAQQRMWFLNRLDPQSGANNIPVAVKLTGTVDIDSMQAAVSDLVERHETLRTVYPEVDGTGTQRVLDQGEAAVELRVGSISNLQVESTVFGEATAGFDVTSEVPVRTRLLRITDTEHILVVVLHHVAADGFSFGPLVRDLMTAYLSRTAGDAPRWAPLPVQYADYTLWQRAQLGDLRDENSLAGQQLKYWTDRLRGLPAQLDIPTDNERPSVATGLGRTLRFGVGADTRSAVDELARASHVTPFMVVHTALAILLSRLSATTDIAVGAPVAGRGEPELDELIGMFVNTLVLRTDVDPSSSVTELLASVRRIDLDAFAHADVPFESLVERLDPARSQGRHPLVQIALFFQNLETESFELPGVTIGAVGMDVTAAKFDLQVTVSDDTSGGWTFEFTYATDLFTESSIGRFASRLVGILEQMCEDAAIPVGDIVILSEAETHALLRARNDTDGPVSDALVLDAFDAHVASHPTDVAVVYEDVAVTFAELDARIDHVAEALSRLGTGPEQLVAVAIRRSIDVVVAVYAALRAGSGFVPIDPDHPSERIAYILEQAQPACILIKSSDGFVPPTSTTTIDVDALPETAVNGATALESFRPGSSRLGSGRSRSYRPKPDGVAYVIFTSGSTGKPKGVAVSHRAIVNQLDWMQSEYQLDSSDVYLQKTATTFDVSLWGYLLPLRHGTTLVVATPEGHRDPDYLAGVIRRRRVTVTDFVPTMLSVFASTVEPGSIESLDRIFVIGEALPVETVKAFARVSSARVHNLYGPTEAAVSITYSDVTATATASGSSVDIGVPESNSQVYVLDSRLNPVADGVTGELYLGGVQLARGYLGRPDLTAGRFVANPFGESSRSASSRMYRTGDLVRWDSSGRLDYLGRTDFQVKFRGQRIELGEVEGALALHDEVSQAAVRVVSTATGDQLVGYVLPSPGSTVDVPSLRDKLRSVLPAYMIPGTVMVLEQFPLNTSGKLDRAALPEPVLESVRFEAPVDPVEQSVAAVFEEVLGVARVGRKDDFFALGGNSLIATRVVARLSELLGSKVALRALFEAPTVEQLAVQLESHTDTRIPLVPRTRPDDIPLSLAQQRMWFLNRLEPESAVNNIPAAIRLSGLLDRHALHVAVADVLARHESLRTAYPEIDGVGYQVPVPTRSVIPDLAPIPVDSDRLIAAIEELVLTGFDVTTAPPFRVRLFEVSSTEHVLVFVIHHIAADGYSLGPLTRDVVRAYTARAAGEDLFWEPLPVQYADYTLWQREALGSEEDPDSILYAQSAYWQSRLDGIPEQLTLPFERRRPNVASYEGRTYRFEVSPELRAGIEKVASDNRATPFMVVHSAVAVLLAGLSGTDDIVIGAPIAGRGDAALDDMIGMFVNTLVLRTHVGPWSSFDDILQQVRTDDLAAFAHADIPFERLVEILDPVRSTAHHPLFQIALVFQNLGHSQLELPNLSVSAVDFDPGIAKFDLQIAVSDTADAQGWSIELNYATDLFDASGVDVLAARFTRVLSAIAADPSAPVSGLDLLDAGERRLLMETRNATDHDVDERVLLDAFDRQVDRTPDASAISFEGETITYREFSARVNRLARYLVGRGVGPDTAVAVGMRRSVELLVGIYAVLRAGGAYVPLDPEQPGDRIDYIVDTSNAVLVLSTAHDALAVGGGVPVVFIDEVALEGFSDDPLDAAELVAVPGPDNCAYVLFTSGSTGRPKGVTITHRAIVNRLEWMQAEYGLTESDVVVQKTPVTFDVSVWELFWPLQVGARMVVARPDGHRDPAYLAELFVGESVSVAHFVPSMLGVFTAEPSVADVRSLRWVFASGEALPSTTAAKFTQLVPSARLVNLYGPTEAAVDVTYHEYVSGDVAGVPIGRPVWNTAVYVLDNALRLAPDGSEGELYLGGVQLARGYSSRPDLTADRFVANPFGAGRLYRTGDVVRWNGAGELVYVGRSDFQVKLRGQRIELGEIESALLADESVAQAVVAVRADRLVAWIVPAGNSAGGDISTTDIADRVAGRLPAFMVPTAYVVLDVLPLTVSGKLDRKALPEPEFEAREYRAPVTPVEQIVADVFADVLDVSAVGLDDDFFALGGNSLIATQVAARLSAALDGAVPVRALFDASTVVGLARRVEDHVGAGGRAALVAGPRPEQIPLSLAQQRMWFLNRFDTESAVNNIPVAIRLTGGLDVAALASAVRDLVARHETLRTVYPESDGVGHQVVLDPSQVTMDLDPVAVEENDVLRAVVETVSVGFDVTRDVPVRVRLFELGEFDHVLVFVVHHIAADGFSMGPLTRDVMVAYAARTAGDAPTWQPLEVQYADYTLWQRGVLGSEDDPSSLASEQVAYWVSQLSGLDDQIELPFDHVRPEQASYRGRTSSFTVSPELHAQLDHLAREKNSSLFMVVHAALAVLMSRLSASEDVAIGTPIAGRGDARLDDLIGMFVNTLVLRTQVEPGTGFADLLAHTREVDLQAFGHADVPFERLVEVLDPQRSQARHPLVQVVLAFQNLGHTALELPGLSAEALQFDAEIAKFDVQFTFEEAAQLDSGLPGGLRCYVSYATDVFESSTIESMGEQFLAVLGAIAADSSVVVGDIEIVDAVTRDRVLSQWSSSGPDVSVGAGTVVDRFDGSVAANPDGIAVRFGDRSVTYRELDASANRLARRLIAVGAGPDSLVAVALPRSVELVVALVAVVKSGAGYLPVDPSYPSDRVEFMVADASPVAVVTTPDVLAGESMSAVRDGDIVVVDVSDAAGEWDSSPVTDFDRVAPLGAENLAYVIYTSGSTGRPKGVLIPHHTVLRLMDNTDGSFGFGGDDVWTMFHSYAFDFSVWELWGPLLYGGTLVVVDYFTSRSPEAFRELLVTEGVTVLNQTPSAFYQLAELDRVQGADAGELALRYVVFGGEALEPRRLEGWFARHGDGSASESGVRSGPLLVNMYGITETTVHVSFRALSAQSIGSASVIGAPISGLGVYVLDTRLQPVPVGVAGELYVSGGQLARGYLGRADLSAVRFVANPFGDGRLYRTGDVARWIENVDGSGELVYLGRADDQVKVRGFRIELGEIEAAVSAQGGVTAAAVIVREDSPGAQRLVAYVVGDAHVEDVRAGVAELVPEYMVPSAFVSVEVIPLTVNGKLDRKALPEPTVHTREFREPASETERIVAEVFADVLGVPRVGLDDDFFDLGGNSLIATQVVSRLGSALDAAIPVRLLFDSTTVASFAEAVFRLAGSGNRPALTAGERPDRIPLSLAQQRMWVLNHLDTQSGAYNIPLAVRLTGELDVDALRAAVADVVVRHEALRTIYPSDANGPEQRVLPAQDVSFDLTPRTVANEVDAHRIIADTVLGGFDVATAVPVRVALVEISPTDHVLALVVHHISADGASIAPLARDVMTAYAARAAGSEPGWGPLPLHYADFALWQRQVVGTADDPQSLAAEQVAYWKRTLSGSPDTLDLPSDRPRPLTRSMQGRSVEFALQASSHSKLIEFTQGRGTSMFMVVHAALAVLLGRLSGNGDVVIGTPVAGRGAAELDDLIGMFVNTLALRTEVEFGTSFAQLVDNIRTTDLDAFDNADIPFEEVADAVVSTRSQARHPIFQVALSFQNLERVRLDLPKLSVEALDTGELEAKFDLQFTVEERFDESGTPTGLFGSLLYATDLFDESTAESFAVRLTRILDAAAADPRAIVGDIDIMSDDEREETAKRASAEAPQSATAIERSLPQVIGSVVELDPEATAFAHDGDELTYLEVEGRASRLARVLIDAGVGPDVKVVVALPVSIDWAVAVWAVVLAGGAVVVGDGEQDDATLVSASSAQFVVGTTGAPGAQGDSGAVLIAVDDPATVGAVASASSRPIAYSARTRLLGVDDIAVVVVGDADTLIERAHKDVVTVMSASNERLDITYESRMFAASTASVAWQVYAVVAAATVGAAWIVPTSAPETDLADLLADEWVTHAFLGAADAQVLDMSDLEDLEVVVLVDANGDAAGLGGTDTVSVVTGVSPFGAN